MRLVNILLLGKCCVFAYVSQKSVFASFVATESAPLMTTVPLHKDPRLKPWPNALDF